MPTHNSQLATRNSQPVTTIVLDAGHGGKDDGCSGKHSKEKYLALNITLALGRAIEFAYPEIKVVYTRKTDVFIPLYRRAAIANENQADLFISIHCNAMGEKLAYIRGTETFVMGIPSENNSTANRENQSVYLEADYQERYQGFDLDSNEGHIFSSIFQNAYLDRSILLAEKIEKYVVQHSQRKSRGVRQDDFVVLRETTMPSVLVETGFLTNTKDEVYLNSKQGQEGMATAIFLAFKEYKEEVEQEAASVITTPIIEEPIVFETPLIEESVLIKPSETPIEAEPIESEAPYRATDPSAMVEDRQDTSLIQEETVIPILEEEVAEGMDQLEELAKQPEEIVPPVEETEIAPVPDSISIVEEVKVPMIQFKIQLAASLTPIDITIDRWQQLEKVEILQERQLYKYLVGTYANYELAAQHRIALTKQGFKGAFVVAYKEEQRISLQEAREMVSEELKIKN